MLFEGENKNDHVCVHACANDSVGRRGERRTCDDGRETGAEYE